MNAPMRRPTSREEFLAWESRQEYRYELDGSAPPAMTGAGDAVPDRPEIGIALLHSEVCEGVEFLEPLENG